MKSALLSCAVYCCLMLRPDVTGGAEVGRSPRTADEGVAAAVAGPPPHCVWHVPNGCMWLAFSPAGRVTHVLAMGSGSHIYLKDDEEPNLEMLEHGAASYAAFSSDGRLFAGACDSGLIKVWEIKGRREVVALTPKDPIRFVRSLAFSPDSKILASADNRGLVHFWDLATGQSRTVFDHRDSKVAPWSRGAWVLCIVFSPDGKKLAIVLATGVIIWDTETERELCLLHPDRKGAYPKLVVFSPEGTHLVVVSGPMLDVWDLGTYRTIRTQRLEGFSGGGCLAYSPQAKLVAAAINVAGFESPSRVVIWDEDTGGELSNFIAFQVGMSGTTPLAFSPDGELLAAGDVNGVVKVWKVADFVPGKPTQEAPDIPSSPTERAPDDRGKPPANTASRATSAAADRSPTPSHVP